MANFKPGDVLRWTTRGWIEKHATIEAKLTVSEHPGPFIFVKTTPGTRFVWVRRMNGKLLTRSDSYPNHHWDPDFFVKDEFLTAAYAASRKDPLA